MLIAEAARNRRLKQTLNLAASTQDGPAALGAILRRQLVTLAKSHSLVTYDRGRELIAELDELRTTIVEKIGAQDSELAFELLWKFLDLNPSILERVDDSSGRVGSVFRMACDDLGPLANRHGSNRSMTGRMFVARSAAFVQRELDKRSAKQNRGQWVFAFERRSTA